jgi:hypothetical protein
MAKIVPHYNPECVVAIDVDETLVKMVNGKLLRHEDHIDALKMHWYRGHHVILWSGGGMRWAEYIRDKLELNNFVHECLAKPRWYVDDLPADKWMERYYIEREGFNGRTTGTHQEAIRDNQVSLLVPTVTTGGGPVLYFSAKVEDNGHESGETSDTDRSGAW